MDEIWKDIEGYEGLYYISNFGRVRSHAIHRKDGKIVRPHIYYYRQVSLHKDGYRQTAKVARLVAKAFIPNPLNKPPVNHKDCNKVNDHVNNLEWATHSEDSCHASKRGRFPDRKGSQHPRALLTEKDVLEIRELHLAGTLIQELANSFEVSFGCMQAIIARRSWTHI